MSHSVCNWRLNNQTTATNPVAYQTVPTLYYELAKRRPQLLTVELRATSTHTSTSTSKPQNITIVQLHNLQPTPPDHSLSHPRSLNSKPPKHSNSQQRHQNATVTPTLTPTPNTPACPPTFQTRKAIAQHHNDTPGLTSNPLSSYPQNQPHTHLHTKLQIGRAHV